MLHPMRGTSGRIVVETPPDLKEALYAALDAEGLTLREWLLQQAHDYLRRRVQPSLFQDPDAAR